MVSIAITFDGSPVRREIYRWLRRNLEWLIGLGVATLIFLQRHEIAAQFSSKAWKIEAFYAAVFDWSSIQSAFLFSIYAFFLSRSEPFIQAIAKTQPFRELRSYILRALSFTMVLTLFSLPLLVTPPDIAVAAVNDVGFMLFSVTMVALAYTFMCFVKVIRVFRKLEKISD